MIAGLVLSRMFRGVGRRLLQGGGNSDGGWRASLVEEGDNVFGLVLISDGQLASK